MERLLSNLSTNNKENSLNAIIKDLKSLDNSRPFLSMVPEIVQISDCKFEVMSIYERISDFQVKEQESMRELINRFMNLLRFTKNRNRKKSSFYFDY